MLNDIMDAAANRINELFGEDTVIYRDAVEQGLQEPCFFVGFLEPNEKQILGNRYFRNTGIYIQYLPGEMEKKSQELCRVLDILTDGMEYITLADESLLRGVKRKGRVSDGVLNFFVDYGLFVIKAKQTEEGMANMETTTDLNGG